MAKKGNNPFRGFVDSISEANRMREHWMTGYDSSARERYPRRRLGADHRHLRYPGRRPRNPVRACGRNREMPWTSLSPTGCCPSRGNAKISQQSVTYYAHERHYGTLPAEHDPPRRRR